MFNIPLRKWLLVTAGSLSLSLGVLGIFLPLLPTTIFLLIAAACFARSSDRLYNWLITHKWFGPYIRNWREHKAITRRTKIVTLVVLWGTLAISAFVATDNLFVRLALLVVGIGVSAFILHMKTLSRDLVS